MQEIEYTEAEIQLLIALLEVAEPIETPNNNHYTFYPQDLEAAGLYFRRFREDWTAAEASLLARGLLEATAGGVQLSPAGRDVARGLRAARPPIFYFYKEYYSEAPHSAAFARFCAEVFGKHLHQSNFSDMAQIDAMLAIAHLGPQSRVLDLGCGAGMIAEYIADVTGAHVSGFDYSQEAIAEATTRTATKRDRLAFQVGNLDALPYAPGSFDTLVSIDTLYMPNKLDDTLRQMQQLLTQAGQMLIFWMEMVWDPTASRTVLEADHTQLAQALQRVGLPYQTWEFSRSAYELMQRKRPAAERLRAEFEAENRLFLYDNLIMESEANPAPYVAETATISRYLYRVQPV